MCEVSKVTKVVMEILSHILELKICYSLLRISVQHRCALDFIRHLIDFPGRTGVPAVTRDWDPAILLLAQENRSDA